MTLSITLHDTGYRTVPATGTETTVANSGTAITLNVDKIVYNIESLLNITPYQKYKDDDDTERYDSGVVDKIGIGIPTWTVSGVLRLNQSADITLLGNLTQMVKTKGYKELGTTASATSWVMIRWINEDAASAHVHVRIKNFKVTQSGDRKFMVKWTLEMVETS